MVLHLIHLFIYDLWAKTLGTKIQIELRYNSYDNNKNDNKHCY